MAKVTKIHADAIVKNRHYIAEWAEKQNIKQVALVRGTGADKGTVSRWFGGTIPDEKHLQSVADALTEGEIAALFRHPDDDWIARKLRGASSEEKKLVSDFIEITTRKLAG